MKWILRNKLPIAVVLITLMAFCACEKQKPEPEPVQEDPTDTVPQTPTPPTNAELIVGRWRQDLVNGSPDLLNNVTHDWEFHADGTMKNIIVTYGDTVIQPATYEVTIDSLMLFYENGALRYYRLDILNDRELEVYSELMGYDRMLYTSEHFYRIN